MVDLYRSCSDDSLMAVTHEVIRRQHGGCVRPEFFLRGSEVDPDGFTHL
jgi:hypothetical protein